ncbi:MAG: catalase [Actinomycetota bacterium]|nr:catalase [Actinomycetota bacterium]
MPGGADAVIDGAIDAILADAPDHTPGTRPIHAPGIAVTGAFRASDVAAGFTDAAHFSGRSVPVTVRFSNGTGSMGDPDSKFLVRGMAVRFHVGAGRTGEVTTDMVGMTLPVFFTRTVETFMEFLEAARPTPVPSTPGWRKALDALRLVPGPSRPLGPGEPGALAFANRYPPARQSMVDLTALSVPESYVTCAYRTVHAFRLTKGEKVASVRFRWEPVAGVRSAAKGTEGDFLQQELRERLGRGPAEFVLRMQVAEQGDDTSDPTKPWSESRRRIVMGHLRVDRIVADQVNGCERLGFDPTRLVPGIELSDDPVLAARGPAYRRSLERRVGSPPAGA